MLEMSSMQQGWSHCTGEDGPAPGRWQSPTHPFPPRVPAVPEAARSSHGHGFFFPSVSTKISRVGDRNYHFPILLQQTAENQPQEHAAEPCSLQELRRARAVFRHRRHSPAALGRPCWRRATPGRSAASAMRASTAAKNERRIWGTDTSH